MLNVLFQTNLVTHIPAESACRRSKKLVPWKATAGVSTPEADKACGASWTDSFDVLIRLFLPTIDIEYLSPSTWLNSRETSTWLSHPCYENQGSWITKTDEQNSFAGFASCSSRSTKAAQAQVTAVTSLEWQLKYERNAMASTLVQNTSALAYSRRPNWPSLTQSRNQKYLSDEPVPGSSAFPWRWQRYCLYRCCLHYSGQIYVMIHLPSRMIAFAKRTLYILYINECKHPDDSWVSAGHQLKMLFNACLVSFRLRCKFTASVLGAASGFGLCQWNKALPLILVTIYRLYDAWLYIMTMLLWWFFLC